MKSVCGACGLTFSSLGSFDLHRAGSYGEPVYNEKGRIVGYTPCERHCLSVEAMQDKGMVLNERGHWTTGVVFEFGSKAG
jgi:hypothetical protein